MNHFCNLKFKFDLKLLVQLITFIFLLISCSDSGPTNSIDLQPDKTNGTFESFRQGTDPGPFIGGGGGEVMVCFGSEEERAGSFAEDGSLLPHARSQILQVYSYDVFENYLSNHLPAFPKDQESPIDFLFRHLEDIFKIAPYFALKLGQSLDIILNKKMDLSSWDDVGTIPDLGDFGKRMILGNDYRFERINLFCRPFQIIHRIETYEQADSIPSVKIKYDAELFDRLNWMNELHIEGLGHRKNAGTYHQAVLILHEALYLMTSSLGETDSLSARKLVPHILFDFKAFESLRDSSSPSSVADMSIDKRRHWYTFLIKMVKSFGLKDYPSVFLKNPNLDAENNVHNQTNINFIEQPANIRRRILAFEYAKLNKVLNQWILDKPNTTLSSDFAIRMATHEPYLEDEIAFVLEQITDIQAFLYVSEIIWNNESREYFHFEFLLITNEAAHQETMIKYNCLQIKNYLSFLSQNQNTINLNKAFLKADNFCGNIDFLTNE